MHKNTGIISCVLSRHVTICIQRVLTMTVLEVEDRLHIIQQHMIWYHLVKEQSSFVVGYNHLRKTILVEQLCT